MFCNIAEPCRYTTYKLVYIQQIIVLKHLVLLLLGVCNQKQKVMGKVLASMSSIKNK